MPTGYTAKLYKGEQSLAEFAWGCARAWLYDWPDDRPIPERFEPGPSVLRSLEEARAELAALEAMTPEEAARHVREEHERVAQVERERFEVERSRHERFEAMARQVRDWTAPSPEHEGIKRLMLKQLATEFPDGPPKLRELVPPLPPAEWLAREKVRAADRIRSCERNLATARADAAKQTAFFATLRDIFGEDPATARAKAGG